MAESKSKKKFYAVLGGRSGDAIYTSWDACKAQVMGVKGVIYKGFPTRPEAEAFMEASSAPAEPLPLEALAVAYVDGSYYGGEFSCGAVLFYQGGQVEFSKKFADKDLAAMHNVAGEIMGALTVIDYCIEQGIPALEIHHDYEGVAKWALGQWKANKPGTIAYAAACQKAREKLRLHFVKVKGHSGDKYNDMADRLAKQALGLA